MATAYDFYGREYLIIQLFNILIMNPRVRKLKLTSKNICQSNANFSRDQAKNCN